MLIATILVAFQTYAQVNVNVNIGTAPNWGPAGYSNVQYYYLPDIETYYDINTNMFIYMYNGGWIRRTYLPTRYRNYDLYGGYKVVLNNYYGRNPYGNFKTHKTKYYKGYRGKGQKNIGAKPMKGKPSVAPRPKNKTPQRSPMQKMKTPEHREEHRENSGGHGNGGKQGGGEKQNGGGGKGGQKGGGNSGGGKGGGGHGGKH